MWVVVVCPLPFLFPHFPSVQLVAGYKLFSVSCGQHFGRLQVFGRLFGLVLVYGVLGRDGGVFIFSFPVSRVFWSAVRLDG